jgi:MinD-like ATPase involved in chromosome partitioning or flagellar assembly
MYVTTFYSFKGGVGRTLALVNVGVDLAQTGKKVLLVDFDLEAPGIDTFAALRPERPHAGVVEYVTDFIANRSAPDVRNYAYQVPGLGRDGGCLWIMPAGARPAAYESKLAAINWTSLYRDLDGYLMFEDLKAQWHAAFEPDYVLVDSRTGHTDVGGICTRQLPDSVVILFFPTEQNLIGLRPVVGDIRDEPPRRRSRPIHTHFVMSNVPDLDDEEQILMRRMREFRDALGYKSLTVTIHRYDSLALLNQVIFTRDRPRSRLAKEYRRLKDAIIAENDEDPQGALRFLERSVGPSGFRFSMTREKLENRLSAIQQQHSKDGEILFLIAMLRQHEGRSDDALALLDKVIESGSQKGKALLERATLRQSHGDRDGDGPRAVADAKAALWSPPLTTSEVIRALSVLQDVDPTSLADTAASPALVALTPEDRIAVAHRLQWTRLGQEEAVVILNDVLSATQITPEVQMRAQNELMLALIGLSRFSEAMRVVSTSRPEPAALGIQIAFNYAMAEWGETRRPPVDFFQLEDCRAMGRLISGDKVLPSFFVT